MRRLISSAILAASAMLTPAVASANSAAATSAAAGTTVEEASKPKTVKEAYGKGITIPLSEDGSRFARIITWHQVWTRFMQFNDNTTINGSPETHGFDIGLRRSRFLLFGKITPRLLIVTHFGINNATPKSQYPNFFMHGAWVDYAVAPKYLNIGAGLHYWNGLSRMSNASTLNFLAVDAPITNWPYINTFDQFGRHLGIFIKGQIGLVNYQFSLNKPFNVASRVLQRGTSAENPGTPTDAVKANVSASSMMFNGYVDLQFLDKEANTLPYRVGTYLGGKKVLNVGVGFSFLKDAYGKFVENDEDDDSGDDASQAEDETEAEDDFYADDWDGDDRQQDLSNMFLFAADVFADLPLGEGGKAGALTAYGVYYHYKMGNTGPAIIGLMNPADVGNTGNAYPLLGDGNHVYLQAGYLLPFEAGLTRFQLYFTTQLSKFTNLDNMATTIGGGLNWLILGHHAKLTLHYRARPVVDPEVPTRMSGHKSEVILQSQIFF